MADITTTRVFTDGERGITATKLNDIVGGSTIQPAFYTTKPVAGSADPADIALIVKAGAYAQVPISALAGSATQAQIWSTRLNSYNAINNPNFEIDQKLCGTSSGVSGTGIDRWQMIFTGTMGASVAQNSGTVLLPGSNYRISSKFLSVQLSTAQASLGASDSLSIRQFIEGPNWRELSSDVHSISLLVQSSVAGLKFGVSLRDSPTTKSLVKLCTIPTANTWTLITLPNIPVWPAANFGAVPGTVGYILTITLAAGATLTTPANDSFQNGNFLGAVGQDSFASKPVNSTFLCAFVQHEPGPVCSTLMDKPFSQNYDECLRYYTKSYDYDVAPGAVSSLGILDMFQTSSALSLNGIVRFPKPMAKNPPIVIIYNHATGAVNNLRLVNGSDYAVSAIPNIGKGGFYQISATGMPAFVAGNYGHFHYTADSGW